MACYEENIQKQLGSSCQECYSKQNRITPLLEPRECLENHLQYICGTCGRCICMNQTEKTKLRRWNFPFQTLEIAILYLRSADASMKTNCGIYEIEDIKHRKAYKIFASPNELQVYLKKNKNKNCQQNQALYQQTKYLEYPKTTIRRLTTKEVNKYLIEQQEQKNQSYTNAKH